MIPLVNYSITWDGVELATIWESITRSGFTKCCVYTCLGIMQQSKATDWKYILQTWKHTDKEKKEKTVIYGAVICSAIWHLFQITIYILKHSYKIKRIFTICMNIIDYEEKGKWKWATKIRVYTEMNRFENDFLQVSNRSDWINDLDLRFNKTKQTNKTRGGYFN